MTETILAIADNRARVVNHIMETYGFNDAQALQFLCSLRRDILPLLDDKLFDEAEYLIETRLRSEDFSLQDVLY